MSFFKKKAIIRQYYTYFDLNDKNINSFLGLFGDDFKKVFKEYIKEENQDENIKAFLELGRLRNELVHQNFIIYNLEKTANEIKDLFDKAYKFLIFFENKL